MDVQARRAGSGRHKAMPMRKPASAAVDCPIHERTPPARIARPAPPRRYSVFACCLNRDCGAGAALTCVSQEVQQVSLTAVLLHVFARVVHQADHVMVVERVERLPAGPADADQARGSQQPKLVRHGRFAESDKRGQVADAALAVRQRIHNAHAGGIAEQFEDVGDGFQRPAAQQAPCGRQIARPRRRLWVSAQVRSVESGVRMAATDI